MVYFLLPVVLGWHSLREAALQQHRKLLKRLNNRRPPPTDLPPPTSTPEPTASATPTVEPTATHTPESTRTAEPTATSTPIVEPTQPAETIFLTVENSEEFAAFINSELEGGPLIEEFVSNNIGNTIVFEGNIAYMDNHGNYDTRYDILIYTGDYSETSGSGPKFKFEDVNINDLHLSGDNIPDTIGMGLNTIFTAEIIEFRDQTQITLLKPVKTEIR